MNRKLLAGVVLAAAGVATYIVSKKRSKNNQSAQSKPQGRSSKHMTDIFAKAKNTTTAEQVWSPAREESL